MNQRPRPAYLWYVRDFSEDEAVKLMTYEQEGVYRRLLDHQWFHFGLPGDVRQVAALVPKVPIKRFIAVIWPAMEAKFTLTDGRLINPKLERVRQEVDDYSDRRSKAGKAGAAARWQPHDDRNGKRITN